LFVLGFYILRNDKFSVRKSFDVVGNCTDKVLMQLRLCLHESASFFNLLSIASPSSYDDMEK